MKRLKDECFNQCLSLLREFIEDAPQDNQKEIAVLALNQLQRITAGTDPSGNSNPLSLSPQCAGRPRANLP